MPHDEYAWQLASDRHIDRRAQIGASKMPVTVQPQVDHVVIAWHLPAQRCRPFDKAVAVVMRCASFTIAVVGCGKLGGEPRHWKILAIKIGDQHVVGAQLRGKIVQAAVGVLLQPPEPGEVVLVAVVGTIAIQTYAELIVLKQKAAEIAAERL